MSLEAGTYISDLVVTNPLPGDQRTEGDDHLRLIKAVLKATFPNITGPITATQAQLNNTVGSTSAIQTQLDTKPPMPVGTVSLFFQAAAPTGWTQVTTQNDKALRVVSGVGGGVGGTYPWNQILILRGITGVNSATSLDSNTTGAHYHGGQGVAAGANYGSSIAGNSSATDWAGGGASHNHTFTGTNLDMSVQYINILLASRT